MAPAVALLGDQAVRIRFGDEIAPDVHRRVQAALRSIDRRRFPWVVDCVPGYCSLVVQHDDALITAEAAGRALEELLRDAGDLDPDAAPTAAGRLVEIPVWYDPEVGPDLEEVAAAKGMSIGELIDRHSGREYLVYVLGFRPGFPFMGTLDDRLAMPRLPSPRLQVAAGSVAIAARQTAIYPSTSPGGWRVLGRTPRAVFDPRRGDAAFLLEPGDRVRFVPIDRDAFRAEEERAHAVPASSG